MCARVFSSTRFALLLGLVCVTLVSVLNVTVRPAEAHTDLLQSSPGKAASSGGEIDFLDIAYTEPVSNVKITVTDPDGGVVGGKMSVDQGFIISYDFDKPLSAPGRYTVSYTMTSFDLDFTEDEFFFDYDPEAPQPFRIGADGNLIVEEPGVNWLSILSTMLLVASVLGAAVYLLYRRGAFSLLGLATGDASVRPGEETPVQSSGATSPTFSGTASQEEE